MGTTDTTALARERDRIRSEHLALPQQRPPSSARGLHHTALISSDVERTVRFYQDVLEFPLTEIVENRDYEGSSHFFFDIGNGNLLAFFDLPGLDLGDYAEVLGGLHHMAISVDPDHWGRLARQPRQGRGGLPARERHVDLLPRPRRRQARADRRPARRDVRPARSLSCRFDRGDHRPDRATR